MASGQDDIPIDVKSLDETEDLESYLCNASHLSLASSVDHYRLENNRRYHTYRDGSYFAPHDKESVGLDTIAHHLFLLTLNDRLFLAPLEDPKRVLDVGTGNGIWAQNFADKFPEAEIIATDLARIQDNISLPNLHFEIDDCCSDWVYPADHFDYIHVRRLYGSVGDWSRFYKECYDHLAPGALLEHTEPSTTLMSDDDSIPPGSPFQQSNALAIECGQRFGKPMAIQNHIKGWITEAGFEDVVEEIFKWPLGDWPADPKLKDIGRWNATQWNLGIEGWSLRLLTQTHGWTADEVRRWNKDIRNQITARKSHGYQLVSVVYARKPAS